MNENTHSLESLEKKPWYRVLLKILLIVGVFFLVIFTIMANIGGNDEFYKESVEGYFKDLTGYETQVGTLNNIRFFPTITFDFQGVELRQNAEDETPVAFLDTFQFRTKFWDVALNSGKIKQLNIQNFKALPGAFTQKSLILEKLTLEDKPLEDKAFLVAQGQIGEVPLKAKMDMAVSGLGKGKKYRFAGERDIEVSLGAVKAQAYLKKGIFDDLKLALAEKPVLDGRLSLSRKGRGFDIDGEFTLAGYGSDLLVDLYYGQGALKGEIKSTVLRLEDFKSGSPLREVIQTLNEIASEFPLEHLDVDVAVEDVLVGEKSHGAFQRALQIQDHVLGFKTESGFQSFDVFIKTYMDK